VVFELLEPVRLAVLVGRCFKAGGRQMTSTSHQEKEI
jgi:hypothetical protein